MAQSVAPRQVRALCGLWDLTEGNHPSLARHLPELLHLPLFPTAQDEQTLLPVGLPITMVTHGHHLVRDARYLAAAGEEPDTWPLAPVFVRDLCGRVIHTGLNPLAAPPSVPLFPTGCADVTASVSGSDLIENAAFFSLRRIECAPPKGVPLAGQADYQLQAITPNITQYPYKMRVDTFYADGWRLPQVVRVFARPVSSTEAQKAGEELMQRWQQRPEGQGYEAFYEANDGATWFESLFLRGCTVIPTFEACNGRYHVDADFRATEADPGRAVSGLHVVVEERESHTPKGTILEVVEPGWVMQTMVNPAKVVVSDGRGFLQPEAPLPLLPNLTLPHPRVAGGWGAVWLPTHPQHFAEPALWDWSETGHFSQISGPLWDPLHYTYTSTQPLLRALRRPVEDNPYVFQLPQVLKERFHPVIAMSWVDVVNERTAQQRGDDATHPLYGSVLDAVVYGKPVSALGYHPLPEGLMYENDPATFPALDVCHQTRSCPPEFINRLAPVAELLVPSEDIEKHNVVLSEPMRAALAEAVVSGRTNPYAVTGTIWLPHVQTSHLMMNVKRLFASRAYRQQLQNVAEIYKIPNLATAFYRFREAALSWRRLRYRLFIKYPSTWQKAWKTGLDLPTAETLVLQGEDPGGSTVPLARRSVFGVKPMPLPQALHLPSLLQKGKLPRERV